MRCRFQQHIKATLPSEWFRRLRLTDPGEIPARYHLPPETHCWFLFLHSGNMTLTGQRDSLSRRYALNLEALKPGDLLMFTDSSSCVWSLARGEWSVSDQELMFLQSGAYSLPVILPKLESTRIWVTMFKVSVLYLCRLLYGAISKETGQLNPFTINLPAVLLQKATHAYKACS